MFVSILFLFPWKPMEMLPCRRGFVFPVLILLNDQHSIGALWRWYQIITLHYMPSTLLLLDILRFKNTTIISIILKKKTLNKDKKPLSQEIYLSKVDLVISHWPTEKWIINMKYFFCFYTVQYMPACHHPPPQPPPTPTPPQEHASCKSWNSRSTRINSVKNRSKVRAHA